jgi:type VI secretion system protein ImpL
LNLLRSIPPWVFWAIGVLAVITALVVLANVLLKKAKKKREEEAKAALPPGAPPDPATEIPRVFSTGRKLVQSKVSDKAKREDIPRLLVIGEPGSGKTTLLAGSGMGLPFGVPSEPPAAEPAACRLWFFDSGIAVDVAGALVLGEPGKRDPDGGHFNAILNELKKERPERPLDGILVTVPCRDLLPGGSTPEDRKRKATVLHKRILDAQASLGMAVPVYVLVTQCDQVTGFTSFGNEVSSALRQSMLGWSSPVVPGSDTVVDWVDETFSSVHESLLKEQSRRFASEGPVRHPDSFFLFPSELNVLADPLRSYIDELFMPTAFEEPLILRGIYFCGDVNATTLMSPASRPLAPGAPQVLTPTLSMTVVDAIPGSGAGPQIIFVKDLFQKKIFPEANLGRPSVGAVKSRNRGILAIQVAAVGLSLLFAAAIAITSERLKRETESVFPYLSHLASSLSQMSAENEGADPTGYTRMERSRKMLDNLSAIETNGLSALFIPGSWVSRLDSRVEGAIALGYERVLLDTYRRQLDVKIKDLISDSDPIVPIEDGEVIYPTSLEKTPEFRRLEAWLRDVGIFEAQANRYNQLISPDTDVSAKDIQDISELAEYLLIFTDEKGRPTGYKVQPSFFSNSKYYREGLNEPMALPAFPFEKYRQDARAKSDRLFEALYGRMLQVYKDDYIRKLIADLKAGLEALEQGGETYTVEQLRRLYDTIVNTEEVLSETNLAWVATSGLPDNPGIARLLQAVRESKLLGPDVHAMKKDIGETQLRRLKAEIENATAPISGQILARDKTGAVQMKLSPVLIALKEPMKALLSQGFMSGEDGAEPPEDRDSERISWDVEVLKGAAKLPKQYEEFNANEGFKPFPDAVRDTVQALALRKLNSKVLGGINRAIDRTGALPASDNAKVREANARTEIANFAQAGVPLREVLVALNRLQQGKTTTRLRNLITAQGTRLLGVAWNVFNDPEPYRIKQGSFGWWDGDGVPVFGAFDVADAAGLAERMVSQRVRVDTLGKELADPVLAVLESGEVGASGSVDRVVVDWHEVVRPMRDYETQKPGNSVSALERFLLNVMPTITFENCLLELERVGGETAEDFFTRKKNSIRRLLRERCEYLAKDNVADKYSSLRRLFTRYLAEKFPFAKNDGGARREDASPDAVRKFLDEASDFRKRYRGFLKQRGSASDREVVRFLDKMENVKAFLGPMWGQSESTADGVFDVRVEFRVNQAREVGGNQIAAWTLRFAQEKLVMGGPKGIGRWRLGDGVFLDLRWAKNGPNVPVTDKGRGVAVREKTATFEESGVWAMLRLIAAHQTTAQDPLAKADTSSNVLSFEVPTIPDPTGGFLDRVGTDPGLVRVFIRIGVSEADKDKLLKYPEFPTVAPAL